MGEMNKMSSVDESYEPNFDQKLADISTRYIAVEGSEDFADSGIDSDKITADLVVLTGLEAEAQDALRRSPDEEKTLWENNLDMVKELIQKLYTLKELSPESEVQMV